MQEQQLLLQIQASYNQLTKAERKVADYVIAHQKEVIYMSITDLADACHVGDTSVYRFCRTMNLQGYQEFKMKLSLSIPQPETEEQTHAPGNLAQEVRDVHIKAVHETFMLLKSGEIDKVLSMMEQAERIFFLGVGDSLLTAQEACNKFLRITNKALCITDPHMQAMTASTASPTDMILIISYSGATKDNIYVAKLAKRAGARVAAITHFKKSPLTAYTDAILLCGADEGPMEGGSMAGKMGQLYLIDLLFKLFYTRNYEECKANHVVTSQAVVDKLF